MSEFQEAQDATIAALRAYGVLLPVTRPSQGYNPATRKRETGSALAQALWGRVDSPARGNGRAAAAETKTFERSVILSPEGMAFEPAIGDLVEAEGRRWRIEGGLNITRGGGLVIVIEAGLVAA